ncbi:O-antigen ligase family protein [Pelagicoccus sp. SDUM812003]|uniref:O-antigen ligase family protein n=1 Tax=Pelagicoccus sp. SDUM812003 TaxID=3041267 RepID=UPI00280F88E8|nr:O-antigen ligase family protein [Pelagicoccus sp. SDUM812003]MDQ8204995.1 hypothetical protein [Pelagicoccus sp. SDUM812003]
MPPTLALLLTVAFIVFAISREKQRAERASLAIIWPFLWYLVTSSRPVGVWFSIWNIPILSAGGAAEGSPADRLFYATLTLIGFIVLYQRNLNWSQLFSRNKLLIAFLVFLFLSITWSDYMSVSFKRYIKLLGSFAMALIILTDRNPLIALTTVIRWTALIHVPLSILFIRYFRHLGVSFDWSGTAYAWNGLSTSKNTLGQVVVIAAIYFLWEVSKNWKTHKFKSINFVYLLLSLYLLKGSDNSVSMTSVSIFALSVFIFYQLHRIRNKSQNYYGFIKLVMTGTFFLLGFMILHSIYIFSEDSPLGWLITKLGRDITLTDRTYIWSDVYRIAADSPLLGTGFGGFWIGKIANIPWNASMTWVLTQSHSGYIDTYLHTGIIGVIFLVSIINKTSKRLSLFIHEDFTLGRLLIIIFLAIVYINITESTFLRGDHHMWFLFLLTAISIQVPASKGS